MNDLESAKTIIKEVIYSWVVLLDCREITQDTIEINSDDIQKQLDKLEIALSYLKKLKTINSEELR